MIKAGTCVRSNHAPRHIYVVLNDPRSPDGAIVLVNFTTYDAKRHGKETLFSPADYLHLTHESVLAFWKSLPRATGPKLEQAIAAGDFTAMPEIPRPTLERMIAAGRASRHLSPEQKRLLA